MVQEIVLPKLGESMEEGTIVNWLVEEGAMIKKGEVIMEIETDKAVLEVESLVEGELLQIIIAEGESVPIGTVVGYVGKKGDKLPDDSRSSCTTESDNTSETKPIAATADAERVELQTSPNRSKESSVAPRALKLAQELGVDIQQVIAAGSQGRITSKDVQAFFDRTSKKESAESSASDQRTELLPFNRLRRITGEKMSLSRATIPCFDLTAAVEMDHSLRRRSELNTAGTQKIAVHDMLIWATAQALDEYSLMTGQWTEEGLIIPENYGIGLAIGMEEGLVAPVLQDVRNASLQEIAAGTSRLIAKAKAGKLEPDDLTGACTTISNLGMLDVNSFTPIVIPGQSSIIGVGKIAETVVSKNGKFEVEPMMNLTISVDHRVTDGAYAAGFLGALKKNLEKFE